MIDSYLQEFKINKMGISNKNYWVDQYIFRKKIDDVCSGSPFIICYFSQIFHILLVSKNSNFHNYIPLCIFFSRNKSCKVSTFYSLQHLTKNENQNTHNRDKKYKCITEVISIYVNIMNTSCFICTKSKLAILEYCKCWVF